MITPNDKRQRAIDTRRATLWYPFPTNESPFKDEPNVQRNIHFPSLERERERTKPKRSS